MKHRRSMLFIVMVVLVMLCSVSQSVYWKNRQIIHLAVKVRCIFENIGIIGNALSPADERSDEEIEAFLDGIQTAEQTAKMLQDRMTFMLEE